MKITIKFFLKTGIGIGAAYGGWYGIGTEAGYGIISAIGGCGGIYANRGKGSGNRPAEIGGKLGWQTGLRLYFSREENNFRPSLAILFERVYPHVTWYNDQIDEGVYLAFSPSFLFEHRFKKVQKIALTYGTGPVLYENMKKVNDHISELTGNDFALDLTLTCGFNFYFF